jgi:hypothetical protein
MGAQPPAVAAEAEAELALAMPASEWALRAGTRLGDRRPVETLAAAEAVVREVRTELAPSLAALLRGLDDADLFRAVAMTLGASREDAFVDALLDLVDEVPIPLLDAYTDALAICRAARRDQTLSRVSARARRAASPPEAGAPYPGRVPEVRSGALRQARVAGEDAARARVRAQRRRRSPQGIAGRGPVTDVTAPRHV